MLQKIFLKVQSCFWNQCRKSINCGNKYIRIRYLMAFCRSQKMKGVM